MKIDAIPQDEQPAMALVKAWLDRQADDEVFYNEDVANGVGRAANTLKTNSATLRGTYFVVHKTRRVWGNPRAIAKYKERFNLA